MSSPSQSSSAPLPPKSQRKSPSDNNNSQNTNPDDESLQVNLDSSRSGTPSRHASSFDLLKSPVVGRITDSSRTPRPVPKKKALRGSQGTYPRQRSSSYDLHSSSSNPQNSPIRNARSFPVLDLEDEIQNFGQLTIHTPAPPVRRAPKRKTMDVNEGPTASTSSSNPRVKMARFATSGTGGQGSTITSGGRGASRPRRVPHRRALFGSKPSSTSEKPALLSGPSRNDIPSTSANIPKTPESSPDKKDAE